MELSVFHTPFYILEQKHLIYNKTEKRKRIIKKQKNQRKAETSKKAKCKAKNKKNIIKKNRKGYKKEKIKK